MDVVTALERSVALATRAALIAADVAGRASIGPLRDGAVVRRSTTVATPCRASTKAEPVAHGRTDTLGLTSAALAPRLGGQGGARTSLT